MRIVSEPESRGKDLVAPTTGRPTGTGDEPRARVVADLRSRRRMARLNSPTASAFHRATGAVTASGLEGERQIVSEPAGS